MFEDRDYNTIMAEMLSEFSSDVRTDEGSLAFNACARIAQKLEEFYTDLSLLNDNLSPLSMDDSHIIDYGNERGIEYHEATPLTVEGTFSAAVNVGDVFECGGYEFSVVDEVDSDNFIYSLECSEDGTAPNIISSGTLVPIEYIDDVDSGTITNVIALGKNEDDIEVYRQKVLDSFKQNPVAGNKDYYSTNVNNIDGVGGCKPIRRQSNSNLINIYIVDDNYSVPSSDLVDEVQELVDPSDHHGEGLGIAPMCHNVNIVGAGELQIDVTLDLVYESDYGWVMLQDSVYNAINDYFVELRSTWESNGSNDIIVRIAKIISILVGIEGIADVNNVFLCERGDTPDDSNIVVGFDYVPTLGNVTEGSE